MALPKWTDERTQSLVDFVGSESPVSQGTVADAAEELEKLQLPFILFKNEEKKGVNILFRRKDGNIGWVQSS